MTSARPLTVGVDARELLGDTTGVGRYLGELLLRWTHRPDAARRRFVLFTPSELSLALPREHVDVRVLRAEHGGLPAGASAKGGTWWEQTALRSAATREPLDVFFAPAYTAPLGLRVPLALTIHDVSFLAHPEWFRPRERLRRRVLTRRSAQTARVVFTDSNFSRDEIRRHIGIDADRVVVIPPGVTPRGDAMTTTAREPLVLYVGSLFNRRRLPQLIEAFAIATADLPAARLAIVGSDRTWPHQDLAAEASRHRVSSRVELKQYVGEAELASLYRRASAFVFLSEYEGFGLTPLEALTAGIPIVVLDTPVAREVYGPAATYVPITDGSTAAAAAIRDALHATDSARRTLAQAPAVLARYSWDEAAERTLRGLESIVRPPR